MELTILVSIGCLVMFGLGIVVGRRLRKVRKISGK